MGDVIEIKYAGNKVYRINPEILGLDEDRTKMQEQLTSQARLAYEAEAAYQEARAFRYALEAEIKTTYAKQDGVARASLAKVTEGAVQNSIMASKDYIEMNRKVAEAVNAEGQLLAVMNAFSQRKECLLELARNYRAEITKLSGQTV